MVPASIVINPLGRRRFQNNEYEQRRRRMTTTTATTTTTDDNDDGEDDKGDHDNDHDHDPTQVMLYGVCVCNKILQTYSLRGALWEIFSQAEKALGRMWSGLCLGVRLAEHQLQNNGNDELRREMMTTTRITTTTMTKNTPKTTTTTTTTTRTTTTIPHKLCSGVCSDQGNCSAGYALPKCEKRVTRKILRLARSKPMLQDMPCIFIYIYI